MDTDKLNKWIKIIEAKLTIIQVLILDEQDVPQKEIARILKVSPHIVEAIIIEPQAAFSKKMVKRVRRSRR